MVGKTHFGSIPASFDVQHMIQGEKTRDSDECYARFIRSKVYSMQTRHLEPNAVPDDIFMDAFLTTTTIREMSRSLAH